MCKFCEDSDIKVKGKFAIYITKCADGTGSTLSIDYNGYNEPGDAEFEVNFCPMCGDKLNQVQESTELTEALEVLRENGFILENTETEED